MSAKAVQRALVDGDPQAYEDQHVHAVYDQIASHFSATRYKVRVLYFNGQIQA